MEDIIYELIFNRINGLMKWAWIIYWNNELLNLIWIIYIIVEKLLELNWSCWLNSNLWEVLLIVLHEKKE